MKIIFGLGNPGQQYKNNRHNIGYMIVDELVRLGNTKLKNSFRLSAHVAKSNISGQDVMFVKPRTFMNRSGECVRKCLAYYKIDICDILIAYDDVDLKLGDVRFRGKGTSGGHRGMESIISAFLIEYLFTMSLKTTASIYP